MSTPSIAGAEVVDEVSVQGRDVHCNEPGRTDWEGFRTGTTAAAAGGVTSVCDMPLHSHPPTLEARALGLKQAAVELHARVDVAPWGGIAPTSLQHLADLRRLGVVGVKGFMCDSRLPGARVHLVHASTGHVLVGPGCGRRVSP